MRSALPRLFACSLFALGCGSARPGGTPETTAAAPPSLGAPPAAAIDPAILANADNAFGFDLWKAVAGQDGNFALSPASLATAFAMVESGARGTTLAELRKVLHLDALADADVHAATGALLGRWNAAGAPYALKVANRLFGEQTLAFLAPFLATMSGAYAAPLEPVDFIGGAEPARVHINDWAATATAQRIKDLIPAGALDADTRLVLVNAVYFKGRWATRFDPAHTRDGDFQAPGKVVRTPFMYQLLAARAGQTDDASLLELPYAGGDLTMTFVLPQGRDLAALEASLSPATLARWSKSLSPRSELQVGLPRFKISTDSISLAAALKGLGLSEAFTPAAHFEGMSAAEHLFIKDAFHKVFVEVNEEGTEAAAATAVVMTKESAPLRESFIADRPFLFFLRDTRSGHVLFMGRVTNPAS